jgi:UDP-2-acetamido-3-amino-2,3-dideoxy-glucuronate N-acetyltransferase
VTTQSLNYKGPMGMRIIKAFIDATATWGENTVIWHFARILQDVRLGDNVSIGGGTEIGRGSIIGDGTRIGANCFLPPNTIVGNNVFIGPGVVMCDDKYPYVHEEGDAPYTPLPPRIEDGAVIGAHVTIGPDVTIGKDARIAMHSCVTKEVVEYSMVKGTPARPRPMPVQWEPKSWTEQQSEKLRQAQIKAQSKSA